ncbi:MAG: hypothetical protein CVT67_04030 [Actinobacteria bacterium HGW-Actinobacteria-7]|nr:MAG: hypothetical protein CVT67_04030 [Actinobacteria bacterium HGW-Actinobacteria-7]
MSRRLNQIFELPGRLFVLFIGLAGVYVVIDAMHLWLTTGVDLRFALFSPTGHDLFSRLVVVVLAAIAAVVAEAALTQYRRTSRELRAEQSRLLTLYEKNPSAIVTLDHDMRLSYVNGKAVDTMGLDAADVVGQVCYKAIMGSDEPCHGCLVDQVFSTGRPHSRIKHETTAAGCENWLSQSWYPLLGPDGQVESVVEIASDVSALKLDALTSLPNRLLLRDRLEIALAGAKRHDHLLAVLFMDIDGFKRVNDTLGHAAGDALLAGFAERLRGIVRQDETLARISGDEFVLLLPSVSNRAEVGNTATRILEHLAAPFVLDGREQPVTASVGVAIFGGGDSTAEELLERADQAMYAAKSQGGNTYRTSGPASFV